MQVGWAWSLEIERAPSIFGSAALLVFDLTTKPILNEYEIKWPVIPLCRVGIKKSLFKIFANDFNLLESVDTK